MGNNSSREGRHHSSGGEGSSSRRNISNISYQDLAPGDSSTRGRSGRSGRPDILFGIPGRSEPDGLEVRRETKQERDARRLGRERVARAKERERSMREEHVDGGYLVTQGVYTGTEDFNKEVVRRLMV